MDLKTPRTFLNLVERLKEHNMIVEDSAFAEQYLKKVHYYRFTGYALQFRVAPDDSNYIDGISFEHIAQICNFDAELRSILLKHIEILEIYFRTQISHHFSIAKCSSPPHDQHYDIENYHNKSGARAILNAFNKQKKYYNDTLIFKHHKLKYGNRFPLWVIAEMMSFSNLSKLYGCMRDAEKDVIALAVGTGRSMLKNHLHCLSVLRNKCAHAARLYNAELKPSAQLSTSFLRKHAAVLNNSLFAYILVVIQHLPEDSMKLRLIKVLKELINKYNDYIEIKLMGFPENFEEILIKNRK